MEKRPLGELLTGFARVRAAQLDNAVTTMRLDDRYATAWLVNTSEARGPAPLLGPGESLATLARLEECIQLGGMLANVVEVRTQQIAEGLASV